MTPEQRELILQALWPEGAKSKLSVWGILDCARDPKIYLALVESKLSFAVCTAVDCRANWRWWRRIWWSCHLPTD